MSSGAGQTQEQPKKVSLEQLQERTSAFLTKSQASARTSAQAIAGTPERRSFSHFIQQDQEEATALTNEFMKLADAKPTTEGLDDVLDRAGQEAATRGLDLVKHSLMMFITHHTEGSRLPIPSLQEREPEKLRPSLPPPATRRLAEEGPSEEDLNWYREDPWANEHHEHWHIVYPWDGIADGRGGVSLKDRQGELFLYMHQQMLARYDTERLAAGLDRVIPLGDYRANIAEGYDAGLPGYMARPEGIPLSDVNRPDKRTTLSIGGIENARDNIDKAIQGGSFERADGDPSGIDPSLLGATEEASIGSASREKYGSHHNNGHMIIAYAAGPLPTDTSPQGVMGDTATAIRDPVFYRWHRHIDDSSFRWQEAQAPNDFSDAPDVLIRKSLGGGGAPAVSAGESPDIILCFKDSLPDSVDFDGAAFGEKTFGGTNWGKSFAKSSPGTDTLETSMRQVEVRSDADPFTIRYLDQREFVYFIRIKNTERTERNVTIRTFLVPKERSEDRRAWIELDKFRHTLPAGGVVSTSPGTVIFRPSALSSVIRKPAAKPPDASRRSRTDPTDEYCDCGWPFNLLLPRGTRCCVSAS